MRRMMAVAALAMVAGCTSQEVTEPSVEAVGGMEEMLPQPDDGEPEPEYTPTKPTSPRVASKVNLNCLKNAECRRAIAGSGPAFAVLYKQRQNNLASVMMAPAPEAEAAMKAGYSMVCEITETSYYVYEPMSLRCTIKFLGALTMTLIMPWECATGVGCVAGAVAAGYAWDDFFTDEPRSTQDEANRYLRDWTKDPREW